MSKEYNPQNTTEAPPLTKKIFGMNEYQWMTFRQKMSPLFFLAPALTLFCIFVLFPIFQSIWISFTSWNGFGAMEWVGLKNYQDLFVDPAFYTSLINNALWLVLTLFAPVLGLIIALFLNQQVFGIKIVKSLFFLPFVINLVVIGLIFSWFYNPDLGLLVTIFEVFNVDISPFLTNENTATVRVILASLWPQTAYCMILYLTGLASMNAEVVEAARIDGADKGSMLFRVIIPQLRSATFIATVVTIVGALRSFDLISIMTAGGPFGKTNVLAYFMYQEAIFNFKMGYGASIAVILLLFMLVFISLFLRVIVKGER